MLYKKTEKLTKEAFQNPGSEYRATPFWAWNCKMTKEEIDNEITKAKTFKPSLKRFIFATTANKDALIEEYIRIKNIENINEGSFEIYLASWEDIVDLLMDYRNTFNWYINNCQYKDSSDVSVTIDGKTECTIHPQYYRTKKYMNSVLTYLAHC